MIEDDLDDDYDERGLDESTDLEREGCVLGDRCCCPNVFHSSDECYDAEWAEEYFAESEGCCADFALSNLGRHLAIGAALCEAFERGLVKGYLGGSDAGRAVWRPGCGRYAR